MHKPKNDYLLLKVFILLILLFLLCNIILDNLEIHNALLELQKSNMEMIKQLELLDTSQKKNLETLEKNLHKTLEVIENHQKMIKKNHVPGRNEIFDITVGVGLYAVVVYLYVHYVL